MERKVRTPEEMKQIYIHVAGMVACRKEKKEIYAYLKGQGYKNPTDAYIKITQSKDYQRILEQARQMRQKMGNGDPIETEPTTVDTDTAETLSESPANAVILNGVEYTPYVNGDLPADKKEPEETQETEGYADGMVYTKAEPVQEAAEENAAEPVEEQSAEEEKKAEEAKPAEDEKQEKKPEENTMKPPLGLMPAWLWKKKRVNNILAAMMRYSLAGYYTPMEWITELAELVGASVNVVAAAVDNILSREDELNG